VTLGKLALMDDSGLMRPCYYHERAL